MKKLSLLLLTVMCLLAGNIQADDTVFECNSSTGSWTATNSGGSWASNWRSNQTSPCYVDINSGVNNMAYTSDGYIECFSGTAYSCNLSFLTSSEAYYVTNVSFTMGAVSTESYGLTVTLPDGTKYYPSATDQTISFTANAQSTSITIAGTNLNKGIILKNLKITVKESGQKPITSFKVFDNSGSVPYRIPAICTTQSGRLIAIADYRTSKADIGSGRVDLRVRYSDDNGLNWGDVLAPSVMTGDGNLTSGNQEAAYGDPCAVSDRESGKTMVTSCSGYPGFFNGTRTQHQGWARWYSEDGGATWTGPTYLDEANVYAPLDNNTTYGPINGWFVGSGKIHQSRYMKATGAQYYRLYCAGSSEKGGGNKANWVLYSDNFGQSWSFLGGTVTSPVPDGDEPKVEELPNGNIVISSRHASGRKFNIFHFTDIEKAEGYWDEVALSSSANNGTDSGGNNGCNGEIGIYPVVRQNDGAHTWIALQSLPIGGSRKNVSIFYKDLGDKTTYSNPENFAKNWTKGLQVSSTTSAYSTWSMCKDHTLGFLYEENSSNSGYDIVYKNISLLQATSGAYDYDTTVDPYQLDEQTKLDQAWAKLLKEATETYNKNTVWVKGEKLITSASQFSSPYSQNDKGTTDGGNLSDGVLIDNNPATYWHTYYGGGDVTPGTHYLLVEAQSGTQFTGTVKVAITRRAADQDHVGQFRVYGSDSKTGTYSELCTLDLPNLTSGAVVEENADLGKGKWNVLKFLCTKTDKDRGYFHLAEFQLYPETLDPTCKNAQNPVAAEAMAAALDWANGITIPTQDNIDTLQDAYDAYLSAVVTSLKGLSGSKGMNGSNGKFVEGNRVVILKNGIKYNVFGQKI